MEKTGEHIYVGPAVTTRKSDMTIKIASDEKGLNRKIICERMQMPSLEVLKDQISITLTKDPKNGL